MTWYAAGTIRWVGTADRIDACICFNCKNRSTLILSPTSKKYIWMWSLLQRVSGSPVSTPVCSCNMLCVSWRVWWTLLNEILFTLRSPCTQLPRYQGPFSSCQCSSISWTRTQWNSDVTVRMKLKGKVQLWRKTKVWSLMITLRVMLLGVWHRYTVPAKWWESVAAFN